MTFNEWYGQDEIHTYNKTEHECMKMAWNAAINAALEELDTHWYSKDKAQKAVQDLLTNSA